MPRCPHCLKAFRAPLPNMHFKRLPRGSYDYHPERPECGYEIPPEYVTDDPKKVDCQSCLKKMAKAGIAS